MTAEKCTYSSVQFPSVYPNDPIIPHSYQSPHNFWSGEYGQYFLATGGATNIALQVPIISARIAISAHNKFSCCKKQKRSLLSATWKFDEGGNTGNKQAQLATQHLVRHKFHLKKVMEPASSSPPSCQEETCSKDMHNGPAMSKMWSWSFFDSFSTPFAPDTRELLSSCQTLE